MISVFVLVLASAAWLHVQGQQANGQRVARSLDRNRGTRSRPTGGFPPFRFRQRRSPDSLSLVVLIQQLAALLRGGRGTSRLWEELWLVHALPAPKEAAAPSPAGTPAASLSTSSLKVLAAARAATGVGNSPAEAIRGTAEQTYPQHGSSEHRVWMELAACLEVAESSGCPLAELLTRFAAQLEAEEDAEAARQTALAGPKATVRLLSWLPVFGLVLGMALGVDPLGILLNNPWGVATFAAGLLLTVAGRIWSSRLVAAAAGGL
ncbi:type II secretion system F family protein [Paenarthrobacter nitroguajacolicus]|uniref:type II secretion system F family protein n=1 Tax=Paenarthrobacter nitroguajacolicus TaxID=211146 RepID=UPI00248AA4C7|nr:hypothetical protein [Paenarthrobacter nitroguajacolicus]MDI2036521.1 hypothetical protein [Paenarthrobacter nitroguajacolicus]